MANASLVRPDATNASQLSLAAHPEAPQLGKTAEENLAIVAVASRTVGLPATKSPALASV
jgi:hypothetical protein